MRKEAERHEDILSCVHSWFDVLDTVMGLEEAYVIKYEVEEWYQETYMCSDCNTEFMVNDYPHSVRGRVHFCPNCGKRFKGMKEFMGNMTVFDFGE